MLTEGQKSLCLSQRLKVFLQAKGEAMPRLTCHTWGQCRYNKCNICVALLLTRNKGFLTLRFHLCRDLPLVVCLSQGRHIRLVDRAQGMHLCYLSDFCEAQLSLIGMFRKLLHLIQHDTSLQ